MAMQNLGKKTAVGFIYKLLERIGAKGIYFLVSILLARLIVPDHFGIISLVMVFVEICDVFVTHGFGSALVVYQDSDDVDFSTCLFFCLSMAAVFYGGIWLASDYIAGFFDKYDKEFLSLLIKVMGIRIPLAAINTVQHAYVKKYMLFKKFFWSTLIGTVISGVAAVVLAYRGFGVWALAEQYLGNIFLDTIFITVIIKWHPKLAFSFKKLKRIVKYGWKVLLVGLLDTGYAQLRSLVIGKKYSSADLAYYSKGTTIPRTGVSVFEDTINSVFFPAIANCNHDPNAMKDMMRKVMQACTYMIFPIIVGIGAVGKELISWMLTDTWSGMYIYLEIGCLAFLLRPVQILNNIVISASGHSGKLLISDIINKSLGILMLVGLMFFGVVGIAFSYALTNIISAIVNISFVRKIIPYSYFAQLKDITKNLICSAVMGAAVVAFSRFVPIGSVTVKLFSEVILGACVYLLISVVLKNPALLTVFALAKKRFGKKQKTKDSATNKE